jgi:hypothetical protein
VLPLGSLPIRSDRLISKVLFVKGHESDWNLTQGFRYRDRIDGFNLLWLRQ